MLPMVERPSSGAPRTRSPSSPSLYERRLDDDLVRAILTRELSTPYRGADHSPFADLSSFNQFLSVTSEIPKSLASRRCGLPPS
jgi:hypothetical protein